MINKIKIPLWVAGAYFIVSTVLLLLPGKKIPSVGWSVPYFDKIVHIGLFAVLVLLFCNVLWQRKRGDSTLNKGFITIALLAILYGILIEFIQKHFIPFRSFELADIVVDMVGVIIGAILSWWWYVKK